MALNNASARRRRWTAAILLSTLLSTAPPVLALGDSTAVPPQVPSPDFDGEVEMYACWYGNWLDSEPLRRPRHACGEAVVMVNRGGVTGTVDGACLTANPHTLGCYCSPGRNPFMVAQAGYFTVIPWDSQSRTFRCY